MTVRYRDAMSSFKGRVAAITGAGSGIGRALAVRLAKEGAALALSDVNEAGLAETVASAQGSPRVTSTKVDVANREAVYRWADDVVRDHGAAHLVINNAGVALTGTLRTVSYEDFEWLMNINFWGVIHGSLAFLPYLEKSGSGHIVNVSSVFGIIAAPLNGTYNASKFAVRGFSEALRMELEMENVPVGVTCVHPGGIKTNIARSGRVHGAAITAEKVSQSFDKLAMTTPDACAKTILSAVRRNAPRVLVGVDAHLIDAVQRIAPTAYQGIARRLVARDL